jgi:hypothetical protein
VRYREKGLQFFFAREKLIHLKKRKKVLADFDDRVLGKVARPPSLKPWGSSRSP